MKRYVLGFMFSPTGESVALIVKNKPDWQKGHLNGIGGKIEDKEAPLEAMIREFEEETGHRHDDWSHFQTMHGQDWICYTFTANGDLTKLKTTTDEEVKIVDVDRIHERSCLANLYWLIPMALDIERPFTTTVYDH